MVHHSCLYLKVVVKNKNLEWTEMKTIKMCTLRYDYISHGEFSDLNVTIFIICNHQNKPIFLPASLTNSNFLSNWIQNLMLIWSRYENIIYVISGGFLFVLVKQVGLFYLQQVFLLHHGFGYFQSLFSLYEKIGT